MKHNRFFETKRNWKSVVGGNSHQGRSSMVMGTNSRSVDAESELKFTMVSLREMIGKGSGGAKQSNRRRSFR